MEQTSRQRARARLALRAERAFGLDAISIRRTAISEAHVSEAHVADGPQPVAAGGDETQATRAEIVSLFVEPPLQSLTPVAAPTSSPTNSPELPTDQKVMRLMQLDEGEVRGCRRCRLCEQRTHTVFGEGSADAKIFFIGEGPGQTEDQTGRPFVGRAGELLNKMIGAMGLKREEVYIANVVKCRPPGNREPSPDEVATCTPYLERQLEIIRPKAIVTLGKPAAQHMLQTKQSMSSMRGRWHNWRGIQLMPTFHPAYLLRSYTKQNREMVWSDLKQVMQALEMPIPKVSGA